MKLTNTIVVTYRGTEHIIIPSKSLLNDLRGCGIPVAKGCLSGICGTCKITLKKGEVYYEGLPLAYVNEHEVLTCIARACSDIEIEL
jgi:ferredoxin